MVLNATFNNISVIPWWWKIKGITPEPKKHDQVQNPT
jgi:hypothetical protein